MSNLPPVVVEVRDRRPSDRDEAFVALVKANFGRVVRVVRRVGVPQADVEDACQEALLRLWKVYCRGEGRLKVSISTIASQAAINYLRSSARPRELVSTYEEVEEHANGASERTIRVREAKRIANAILDKIPDSQRSMVLLVDIEGGDIADAAADLEIDPDTARSRLHEGREKFRRELERVRADEERRAGRGLLLPMLLSPSALIEAALDLDPRELAAMQDRALAFLKRAIGTGLAAKLAALSVYKLSALASVIFALGAGVGAFLQARAHVRVEPSTTITAEPAVASAADALSPLASAEPQLTSSTRAAAPPVTATASSPPRNAGAAGASESADLAMLDTALAFLNKDQPKRALDLVNRHAKQYPQSPFAHTRESIRARAQEALAAQSDAGAPR